jgi:hypothetical protein
VCGDDRDGGRVDERLSLGEEVVQGVGRAVVVVEAEELVMDINPVSGTRVYEKVHP